MLYSRFSIIIIILQLVIVNLGLIEIEESHESSVVFNIQIIIGFFAEWRESDKYGTGCCGRCQEHTRNGPKQQLN